ncbi:MAG: DUF302 domain-containing protein [Maricaulaceae bacterium]|nr:DUF302 domain-containing protein [Maricaulaceae bacterium]
MTYYMGKYVEGDFDAVVERTVAALAGKGFGVLCDIDVQATLKKKIGKDIPPYRILGACNPGYAHQALSAENQIGVLLPCNVVVRQEPDGRVQVAAVDPVISMQGVDNPALAPLAGGVKDALAEVLSAL